MSTSILPGANEKHQGGGIIQCLRDYDAEADGETIMDPWELPQNQEGLPDYDPDWCIRDGVYYKTTWEAEESEEKMRALLVSKQILNTLL